MIYQGAHLYCRLFIMLSNWTSHMKKILLAVLLGVLASQSATLAESIEEQQEELRKVLTMRFKYENLKSIRDNYEKELNVLEAQYQRNKQIEDFQKKQPAAEIKTAVYTTPFTFISNEVWEQNIINYAKDLTVTKIPRKDSSDLIFHFPTISNQMKSQLDTYKIQAPTLKVVSVLLSSGKIIPLDKTISPKLDEQSITVDTDNASILKINLAMTYQVPTEQNSKTILTQQKPSENGMTLLPSFDNVVVLQLTQDKAQSIIQIDATDVRSNTLASKSAEKINNANDLSTQAIRIDMLKGFIKALDDKEIKNQKDAAEYLVKNSEPYLISSNNSMRQLTKSFAGKVEQVIIYTIDEPIEKQYTFSIY